MESGEEQNKQHTSKQHAVGSGFNAFSTAEEVIAGIDLTNKTAIVTGGYSGIGFETVRVLHKAGAHIIVPTRDMERSRQLFTDFDQRIELKEMNLMDPDSIDRFAEEFIISNRPLHLLINNAGIMASPLQRDVRGYESQLATNHLGHFQLTARLWPALQKAKGARIISVSSLGHRFSPVLFNDPNFNHTSYDRWIAYGQSKTANILFAVALDERGKSQQIRAFSLHPGRILDTSLKKYLSDDDLKAMGAVSNDSRPVNDPVNPLKTIGQGASTTVWCATSPALDGTGGVYCANCDIAEVMNTEVGGVKNASGMNGVLAYAIDPGQALKLWQLSEQLTGVTFTTAS